jgi:N-methylhydantoinase A/oxoprolinase/acetone carboxylase beta subunit
MKPEYGLGIDAGGAYTDAVILDLATGREVIFAKALTTRPDNSTGIRAALAKIDEGLLHQVKLISLATTFATNAIVEDRGAEAGLILIGYEERPHEIPAPTRVLMVDGGHTVSGDEKKLLDLEYLAKNLDSFLQDLEAVAVTGFFSVRNPDHELRAARLLREHYEISVVLGHQLSMRLDAVKRAITAWWNARLIPLVRNLIKATQNVLSEMDIPAPLMIVRGDGTLMSVGTALDRPIDTLLSGPAASILGAKFLSNIENALVVDMGGTTTDMALLVDGRVAIDPQGAHVGKWKTHVEAAKVRTVGLGGDSLIVLDEEGRLLIGPRRVIPLCLGAEQCPHMIDLMKIILQKGSGGRVGSLNPCSFYIRDLSRGSGDEKSVWRDTGQGIVSEFLLFGESDHPTSVWKLREDEKNGHVFQSALTPTDIRVATGQFHFGNPEAAKLGLAIFSRYVGMEPSFLKGAVEEEIQKRLCLEAICFVGDADMEDLSWAAKQWFGNSSVSKPGVDLNVSMTLSEPVIGVGAPAAAYLPMAFKQLNTECILPEPFSVACAVGAIVGMVHVVVTGEIRPTDSTNYSLHTAEGREMFGLIDEAINRGRFLLERLARDHMFKNNIIEPLIDFSTEEKKVTTKPGEEVYLGTLLRVRATGRPNVWKQGKRLD